MQLGLKAMQVGPVWLSGRKRVGGAAPYGSRIPKASRQLLENGQFGSFAFLSVQNCAHWRRVMQPGMKAMQVGPEWLSGRKRVGGSAA